MHYSYYQRFISLLRLCYIINPMLYIVFNKNENLKKHCIQLLQYFLWLMSKVKCTTYMLLPLIYLIKTQWTSIVATKRCCTAIFFTLICVSRTIDCGALPHIKVQPPALQTHFLQFKYMNISLDSRVQLNYIHKIFSVKKTK